MRLFIAILAVLSATPVQAIIIRHDVPDSAHRADGSRFPFLFPLYRSKEGFGDCIATMIAARWAVTAAHCTEDKALTDGVAKGGYEVTVAGRRTSVVAVARYPMKSVDLALVRLANRIDLGQPIQIYRNADETGRDVLLPGWGDPGTGRFGVGKADGVFRIAENRVDLAADGLLRWTFDTPSSGRALALEGISGPGDSGGPALIMTPTGWATVGVSSAQQTHGRAEGLYGAEEIYVRLSAHAAWIDSIIGTTP